jgi:hypothetical protein
MSSTFTGIPVKPETRDDVRGLKRGGEDWDTLLKKMAEQYEPEAATDDV